MPRFKYECPQCGTFVAWEDEIANGKCPGCSSPVSKRFSAPATIYNDFGFSRTDRALKDYRRKRDERLLEPEKGYKSS